MRSLTMVFAIAAAIVFAAAPASKTDASIWQGAATLAAPAAETSPVQPVGCRGKDVHCPPGSHWVCGPAGRCWCAPC
jgi:hypothetical protein